MVALLFLVCAGCTAKPVVQMDANALKPRSDSLFLNMESDPDLMVMEIQNALELEGLRVRAATAEQDTNLAKSQISIDEVPYELTVFYVRGGYPYRISWRSILRDRESSEVIGTYKYDFNAATQGLGWDNQTIIDDMIKNLIQPFWR